MKEINTLNFKFDYCFFKKVTYTLKKRENNEEKLLDKIDN